MTIMWFLAPPRACTRLPVAVAVRETYSAMGVEPTKLTAWMVGWLRMASTATLSPWTTLKTPSGRPASLSISARRLAELGSRSEGLRTKVLPQARAMGNIHIGTMAGEVEG